jgi:hypothetical protein
VRKGLAQRLIEVNKNIGPSGILATLADFGAELGAQEGIRDVLRFATAGAVDFAKLQNSPEFRAFQQFRTAMSAFAKDVEITFIDNPRIPLSEQQYVRNIVKLDTSAFRSPIGLFTRMQEVDSILRSHLAQADADRRNIRELPLEHVRRAASDYVRLQRQIAELGFPQDEASQAALRSLLEEPSEAGREVKRRLGAPRKPEDLMQEYERELKAGRIPRGEQFEKLDPAVRKRLLQKYNPGRVQ